MFSRKKTVSSTNSSCKLQQAKEQIAQADAILIGAGSGLSTAASLTYDGERFERLFGDFGERYGITDMYSGGFYPFDTLEEYWAWWSRHVCYNRYDDSGVPLYRELLSLVAQKDYFVLTTNVDHCFQKAGFDKQRLFYTQGDYGLFQCAGACHKTLYDNEAQVREMIARQKDCRIPTELVPKCPVCGGEMEVNLRCDGNFVEDGAWERASVRYREFLRENMGRRVVFLELGVGMNTPGIIKFPFWQMAARWPQAFYICVNLDQAWAPEEIRDRALCLNGDLSRILEKL